jgi:hypothetical protein
MVFWLFSVALVPFAMAISTLISRARTGATWHAADVCDAHMHTQLRQLVS